MSDAHRNEAISNFANDAKGSSLGILVATNAIEEGIDVAKCNLIVRFSFVGTTTSWIQGAGRARYKDSEILVFENDPHKLEEGRSVMMKAAKNSDWGATEEEMIEHVEEALDDDVSFSLGDAKITFWNCVVELMKYCQKVMKKSFTPEVSLYKFHETKDGSKFIERVCFPTPSGPVWISERQVKDVHIQWEKVEANPRSKAWKPEKFERHRFSYAAMMEIHKRGLIDSHGEHTLDQDSLRDAQRLCSDQFVSENAHSNNVVLNPIGDGRLMLATVGDKSHGGRLLVYVMEWMRRKCPNGEPPRNVLGFLNEIKQKVSVRHGISFESRLLEDISMHLVTLHFCGCTWQGTARKKKSAQKEAVQSMLIDVLSSSP